MWEKLIGWLQFLWASGQETKDNSSAIRELRQNDLELYEALRALAMQNDLLRQALQHEREMRERDRSERERDIKELELKLRLQISEELCRLPPAKDQ